MTDPTTRRAEYVAGLRAFADLLEDRPEVPLPWSGKPSSPISVFAHDEQAAQAIAGALGRPVKSEYKPLDTGPRLWLTWHLAGVHLQVSAPAAAVADRRVTEIVKVGDQSHEVAEWVLREPFTPAAQGGAGDE
jgi:hypothetical protein